ncbi:hypothetical protein BB559_005348 [Furculomyces boomerangus]|uniref:Uncharacterized protein n=1 Tax=Furculomyces boomerangus TaxID=61424 RepID=A0A2T9Y983_9FUNG|nr:hypothetical protein BB559_005348 [Furculomyces boomerangus]
MDINDLPIVIKYNICDFVRKQTEFDLNPDKNNKKRKYNNIAKRNIQKNTLLEVSVLSKEWNSIARIELWRKIDLFSLKSSEFSTISKNYGIYVKTLCIVNDESISNNKVISSLYEFMNNKWPNLETIVLVANNEKKFVSTCLQIIWKNLLTIKELCIYDAGDVPGLYKWVLAKHKVLRKLTFKNTFDTSYESSISSMMSNPSFKFSHIEVFRPNIEAEILENLSKNISIETMIFKNPVLIQNSNSTINKINSSSSYEYSQRKNMNDNYVVNENGTGNTFGYQNNQNMYKNLHGSFEQRQLLGIGFKTGRKHYSENKVKTLIFRNTMPISEDYVLPINSEYYPNLKKFVLDTDVFPHDSECFNNFFSGVWDKLEHLELPTINNNLAEKIVQSCPNLKVLIVEANGGHKYSRLDFSNYGLNQLLCGLKELTVLNIDTGCFRKSRAFSVNDEIITYFDHTNWKSSKLSSFSVVDARFTPSTVKFFLDRFEQLSTHFVLPSDRLEKIPSKTEIPENGSLIDKPRIIVETDSTVREYDMLESKEKVLKSGLKNAAFHCNTSSSFDSLLSLMPGFEDVQHLDVFYTAISSVYEKQLEMTDSFEQFKK